MVKWTSVFLSSYLNNKGADTPPTSIAPWADSSQSILGIRLRLQPPIMIHMSSDFIAVFMNHDFLRLLFSIIWFICCGLIESFFTQLSEMRYFSAQVDMYPLIDLLHDGLPLINDYHIVNYILATCLVYTVILFSLQSPDWTTRWTVLRRWLVVMGFIYIFRGITLAVTTLPSPLVSRCRPSTTALSGSVAQRFGYLFQVVGGSINPCTDQIFSGHTSVIMSCVMVWRVHSRMRRIFAWILYALAFAGIFVIIASHFHYTVDVILAIFIVCTTWNIYMRYIQDATLRYTFAHMRHITLDVFQSQANTADASVVCQYLNWQPNPLGSTWFLWICMYADGLDIRLRALGTFDHRGNWQRDSSQHMLDVHEMMMSISS